MYRNSDLRKAIAFSLFVKAHSRNSIIKNWNINKLHDITGVSVNAIKARLATLRSMGLIEETGVDNKHLVFKSFTVIPLTATLSCRVLNLNLM